MGKRDLELIKKKDQYFDICIIMEGMMIIEFLVCQLIIIETLHRQAAVEKKKRLGARSAANIFIFAP